MKLWKVLSILALVGPLTDVALAEIRPGGLRCEYLVSPLGLGTAKPRLSWVVRSEERAQRQTAYQVLVASSSEKLAAGEGDLWDSGKISSDASAQIVYGGRPLRSSQRCHWKVRVWDRDGKGSEYSEPAFWEMGLLDRGDWHGRWIARTTDTAYAPAPHFRREFPVEGKIRRARAYICGLGYYELRLNGEKIGDQVLDPGYTRYDKRVLYVTHDVTAQVREGKNAIGVILGTGWYNVHTRAVWYFDRAPWRASPRFILELLLEYEDGRAVRLSSDGTWKTATGPIVFDSIYGGETYDARLEKAGWDRPGHDEAGWEAAKVVDAPLGALVAQEMPPIKVTRTLVPAKVTEPKPGVFLYDMGQNFAGFARLTVSGLAGTKIVMKYGERLHADGTLDQSNIAQHQVKTDPPQQFQTDTYFLKGSGEETWEARFVYHGFQYVEVTGAPGKMTLENIRGRVAHSAIPVAGSFECSNKLLNRIWENTRWSYLSNLEGIPTDCPHREKNGWTGDAHLAAHQGLYNYDPAAVYAKWINDLDDEQRKADEEVGGKKRWKGELPGIVPTSGWGYDWGNGPAWDSALLLIPWYMYEHYGDTRILETHYEAMRLYVDYLTRRAEKGIVSIGLGDWCPFETETPVPVTSTGYYFVDAMIVSVAARLLGRTDDAVKYAELARGIRQAFNDKFLDRGKGIYSSGSQTALGCALCQGLAPDDVRASVLQNLVANVERRQGHLDFGILGSKYVLHALTEGGRADVAYRIASQTTHPSWGHWIEQGATTLWESWNGGDSRCHIMFGDISAWFYKALAGINSDRAAPGFKHIVIQPHVVGDLTYAKARYDSIRGPISSSWRKGADGLHLDVEIPANASATVHVPAPEGARIEEGGKPAAEAEGVSFKGREGGWAVFEVGSGSYTFLVKA